MSTTPVKFLRSTFVTLTANLLILFGHWGQELVNLQPHCLQNLIVLRGKWIIICNYFKGQSILRKYFCKR